MPGYGANSGLPGLSGTIFNAHRSDLVSVIEDNTHLEGRKFTLVSPFTGKDFAFPIYERSLSQVPHEQAHVILYDNSNDAAFGAKLLRFAKANFSSFRVIRDSNAHCTLETVDKVEQYSIIGERVAAVYGTIYSEHVPELPFVFNLEDDIGLPDGAFHRLHSLVHSDARIGTAIARCKDRRPRYISTKRSIAFTFEYQQRVGLENPDNVTLVQLPEQDFGVQAIGCGHMGAWMTKRDALDIAIPNEPFMENIYGPDLVYGWRLHQAHRLFVTDWSLKCEHYYQKDGKVQSV